MNSKREVYSKKILEEQKNIEDAIAEKQRLIDLNMVECFNDINNFLLDNLHNIYFKIVRSNRHDDWVVLLSEEEDTNEMTNFISECLEAYEYDPTMYEYGSGSFSLDLYDGKVEIYARDKWSKLQITIRDLSILDDFIDEYSITKLSLGNIQDSIDEYERNLKQLKNIKLKFK